MYQPSEYVERRPERLHALLRSEGMGTLFTASGGLAANPIPWIFVDGTAPGMGLLQGHVARANPEVASWSEGCDALVQFQGPHGYISPRWYPTRKTSGRAVPTWNYAIVQVKGRLRLVEDAAWISQQLLDLVAAYEADPPAGWHESTANSDYVDHLKAHIVGVEIIIESMEGKFKMSQNKEAEDHRAIVEGLRQANQQSLAEFMEALL